MGPEDERIIVETATGASSVPGSGCLAEGREAIVGSVAGFANLIAAFNSVQDLLFEVRVRIDIDPDLAAALEVWAGCMIAQGYDVPEPAVIKSYVVERIWQLDKAGGSNKSAEDAERDEQLIAIAHARCLEESSYGSIWLDTTTRIETAVLSDNENVTIAWLDMLKEISERAAPALKDVSEIPEGFEDFG